MIVNTILLLSTVGCNTRSQNFHLNTSKFVDVLSPIIILLFTSLSFVILPVNLCFQYTSEFAMKLRLISFVMSVPPRPRDTPPIDIELVQCCYCI